MFRTFVSDVSDVCVSDRLRNQHPRSVGTRGARRHLSPKTSARACAVWCNALNAALVPHCNTRMCSCCLIMANGHHLGALDTPQIRFLVRSMSLFRISPTAPALTGQGAVGPQSNSPKPTWHLGPGFYPALLAGPHRDNATWPTSLSYINLSFVLS